MLTALLRVKLFTHDTIVHSQLSSIENTVGRVVNFQITLNQQDARSNIQFDASEDEVKKIKSELNYNILTLEGKHWLPLL